MKNKSIFYDSENKTLKYVPSDENDYCLYRIIHLPNGSEFEEFSARFLNKPTLEAILCYFNLVRYRDIEGEYQKMKFKLESYLAEYKAKGDKDGYQDNADALFRNEVIYQKLLTEMKALLAGKTIKIYQAEWEAFYRLRPEK
jgi:hypothetical protein